MFKVQQAPSDTQMRVRLDNVDPKDIRGAYNNICAELQRGKILENYQYMDGKYLIAIDGTGYFSYNEVYCDNCYKKEHKDEK